MRGPAVITALYTAHHLAFRRGAQAFSVSPFAARIAVAIHERGGEATSHEIAEDLGSAGAPVRRELAAMYALQLARGDGPAGRGKPGTVTSVALTEAGRALVKQVYAEQRAHVDRRLEAVS